MTYKKLELLTTKIGSGITPRGGSLIYLDKGTYLIRSQNIYNDKFQKEGLVCISEDIAKKMKGVEVKENDILINITGDSVARTFVVPIEFLPARVNQHVCILRTNSELNPHYLYYFLIDKITQNYLLGLARSGGTRNALTKEMLENLEISYPEYDEQVRITNYLNAIKNTIELKTKENTILEKMLHIIFKSWFIDFNGQTEFVDSELGEIPRGWEIKNIGGIVDLLNGFSYKGTEKFETQADFVFVTLNNILEGGGFKPEFSWLKSSRLKERHFVEEMDLIMASTDLTFSGRLLATPALLHHPYFYKKEKGVYSMDVIKVIPKYNKTKYFLFSLIHYYRYRIANAFHTGTGVWHFDSNGFKNSFKVIFPSVDDKDILSKFDSIAECLSKQIILNQKQIAILFDIRDSILPKLMSGEIRV